MSTDVSNSIFYSKSDNIVVINEEPLPNRIYKIKIEGDSCTVRVVGDRVKISRKGKPEIQIKHILDKKRNTYNSERIVKWIHSKSPDIERLNYMFEHTETKESIIVKGYVQSGKTSFMLCSALKYMFGGCSMSSIIVLRDSNGDSTQIKRRLLDMKKNITDYLNSQNISDEIDITILNHTANINEVTAAVNGINPKIFIVLGNGSQLRKLNNMIEKVSSPRYAIFIDEADSNDTGENNRKGELDRLKDKSNRIFYISATILEIGLREDEDEDDDSITEENNIYMLNRPEHYMGIEKLLQIPLTEDAVPNNRNDSNPFENDPNIMKFVTNFEKLQPHNVDMFKLKHPQHCLISCGNVIAPQKKLFKFVSSYDIAVILFNGKGVDMYHKSLSNSKIRIKTDSGRTVTGAPCKWLYGAHSFGQSISIPDAIQWFKDNGGVEKFPRIITISGKLAGRGISFVSSDYGKYLNIFNSTPIPEWMGWRLTSMYYIPSKHTSQPNLMQGVGRVCCVCRDNIPTNLYACDEVLMDIRKAYWTQEEMVIRARKLQDDSEENEISILEALNSVKLNTTKLSKRRLTINGVKRIKTENTLEWYEDDNGFDIESTYENVNYSNEFDKPSSILSKFSNADMDNDWSRLVNKMFRVWSTGSTNIAQFMHNLDPDKKYSRTEIIELCTHSGIRLVDVVKNKTGKSNKYGDILRKSNGSYILHPELNEAYKLNF